MIERNVVRVETLDRMGTGLIYPCNRGNRKGYVIFTNRHVLEGIPDTENIHEHIQIIMYDDFGIEINEAKMKNWDCYWNKSSLEFQDDIAAIYLELDDDVVLHLETVVELDELDNRTTLYMEGYPGVMINDDINRRIQLEGVSKFLFPSNKEIGAYQITDDYHWYNNYSDYKVLAGISGSPVYYKRQGRNYILGINQSVANIDQGENPFKLVYYIKFKHILDYLRREDCIIFSKISEWEFRILWVKDKKKVTANEIKLLLIGGSGAGKSSFVKSFAYHQNKIRGVGDGQTTRADVRYSFSRVENNPTAKVLFLSKNKFIDTMNVHIGTQPIRLVIAQALGISQSVVEDEEKFLIILHRLYEQFVQLEEESIAENEETKKSSCKMVLGYIKELLFYGETVKNKIAKYENILDHLIELIPYYFMPCILDENWRNEHAADGDMLDEQVIAFFGISRRMNAANRMLWTVLARKVCKILKNNERKHFDTLQKELVSFSYTLYQMKSGNEMWLINKEKELYDELKKLKVKDVSQMLHTDSHREFEVRLKKTEFQKKLLDSLVFVKGFFDAKEFDFLLGKGWVNQIYIKDKDLLVKFREVNQEEEEDSAEAEGIGQSIQNKKAQNQDVRKNTSNKGMKKDIVISKGIVTILGNVYQKIMGTVKERFTSYYHETKVTEKKGIKAEGYTFCFKLDNMNENDISTLQKCLKVTKEGSFTGIIENVTIQDKISDLYAIILDKLEVGTLTIIDTCGLDHVTIWNEKDLKKQVERLYSDYVKQWEMVKKNQQNRMMETGILYIKKLDSGKPDELNSILPIVRRIIPSTPMYCMFTGIDIFYRTEQEVENIFWKKENKNCPKSVRYILENDMGMQDIVDVNAYKVLRNNLLPFCGDEKLVHTKFAYYKNNVDAVCKMLTSIAMKESSSLEIIDQSFINAIKAGNYDEEIGIIISKMFDAASLHSRYEWWNTKNSDIKSFFKNGVLGYKNTYNHILYFRFHNGYLTAVREKGDILFEKADEQGKEIKYKAAVMASLYNMENLFLGINENLIKMELEDSEKNKFRQIIEKMYEGSEYNPFGKKYKEILTIEFIKENRDEIFDNVFEFQKFLDVEVDGKKILCEIVEFFKEQFVNQIEIDNSRKVTYLVKMNESFVEELDNVKKEFCEKYGDNDFEGEEMFETFMRYYFSSNKGK